MPTEERAWRVSMCIMGVAIATLVVFMAWLLKGA